VLEGVGRALVLGSSRALGTGGQWELEGVGCWVELGAEGLGGRWELGVGWFRRALGCNHRDSQAVPF
jgi:hypothetical protein